MLSIISSSTVSALRSTISFEITSSLTFFCEGKIYIGSRRISSMIIINPLAPNFFLNACEAIAFFAASVNFNLILSNSNLRLYCLIKRVPWFGQNFNQRFLIQLVEFPDNWQSPNKFRNQPIMN